MKISFIEFKLLDEHRFDMLVAVVDALRQAKRVGVFPEDEYWLSFFDELALSHFWWPTAEELKDWFYHWRAAPVSQRFTDPNLQTLWTFDSMIDVIRNGEYELGPCSRVSDDRGRLEFQPYAWPYGGTGALKALIEAYDLEVIRESEVNSP